LEISNKRSLFFSFFFDLVAFLFCFSQPLNLSFLFSLSSFLSSFLGGGGVGGARGGRGGARGGRGGAPRGGMRGGAKVVVQPHRHEGVFIARGKEDALVTRNLVPGESVYGEKRISVEVYYLSFVHLFKKNLFPTCSLKFCLVLVLVLVLV
jgi:hypothetical protein